VTVSSPKACIEIKDLWFEYPEAAEPALKGIDLVIREGEYVVVTGRTGSGKTTLAMCLNGLIPHLVDGTLRGEVVVGDLRVADRPVHELTPIIGMVFQNPEDQLFSLNVIDEVAFSIENLGYEHEEIVSRVDAAIRTVGLTHRIGYSVFHLSGGEKQKTAIASNLTVAPDILVLDAPTADLDPVSSREVARTLIDLRNRGEVKTFIVADSDLSDLIELADRIVAIDEGVIALDGSPQELLTNHFDELVSLGVRLPDHIKVGHYLQQSLPDLDEFPITKEQVRSLLEDLARQGRLHFTSPSEPEQTPVEDDEEPIVRLEGVHFTYDNGPTILDDVDLDIAPGECVAIIGENGSGKSTLMKLVAGLLKPDEGIVWTAGKDTATTPIEEIVENVGYLFQNPDNQLFMGTLEGEIAFGPRRRDIPPEEVEQRVSEALEMIGLERYRDRHPFKLSRGQRQRLAVATVLAARPRLILLDEPTTGQDQISLDSLMELMEGLIQRHNATVIMVTHDMNLVARHATRVLVLNEGQVLLDGTPEHVFGERTDELEWVKLRPPCIGELSIGLQGVGCPVFWRTLPDLLEGTTIDQAKTEQIGPHR
jgi:energy-coupling factor transport system ATP-binding protein